MSAIECQECGWLVDTDVDPGAIWDDEHGKTHIECETCRGLREFRAEQLATEDRS